MTMAFDDYDFLDFGASKGGSIEFAKKLFDAGNGLGIDLDRRKVETMRRAGYDCMLGDITLLDIPSGAVRFVVISHLLEHLPSLGHVEDTLRSAARAASDFIYIQGPFFDADEELARLGLKLYWSDWHGHTCHLTTGSLRAILERLGLEDNVFMVRERIADSSHPAIHPLASPQDQHAYDPALHPPKPRIKLEHEVYREIVCCVRLRPVPGWSKLVHKVRWQKRARLLVPPAGDRLAHTDSSPIDPRLAEMHKRLLLDRGWDYLRYLHLREALCLTRNVRRILSSNPRRGYQEIALAVEHPELHVCFVPPSDSDRQRYRPMRELIRAWRLVNVSCAEPGEIPSGGFDLVAAADTPVDKTLLDRLFESAEHYLWLLAPRSLDHISIPPDISVLQRRGCYWQGEGAEFSRQLKELDNAEIMARMNELKILATNDLVQEPPMPNNSLGYWLLGERSTLRNCDSADSSRC